MELECLLEAAIYPVTDVNGSDKMFSYPKIII
jgi:hypothetical protein